MSLLFSWVMWKFPLSMFSLALAWPNQNKIIRFVTWGISVLVLLLVDILLTIFAKEFYKQYMFFVINGILAMIVSVLNNRSNGVAQALGAAFLPLGYIALLYFTYTLFWPFLF